MFLFIYFYIMKKILSISILLAIISLLFWQCNKRPFAHVEVSGRVLNDSTKLPLPATISLWGNDQAGTKAGIFLGQIGTNGDGTFDLNVQAVWSNAYWLYVDGSYHKSAVLQVSLKDNHNVNVGNIIAQ